MPTDAALFEEVVALLDPNTTVPLARSLSIEGRGGRPSHPSQLSTTTGRLLFTDSRAFSAITPQRQALKHNIREEKEAIRKRQYHQRVKIERDSLRQTAKELTRKLRELQQSKCPQQHGSGPQSSLSWSGLAEYQRDQRKKAEEEQTRLFAAAKMQAVYIGQLCERLPGNSNLRTPSHRDGPSRGGGSASKKPAVES
ncbi:hypothetical protein PHYSODRAFT_339421 [Phytophthora sojae]|uniref:Uncharacterized protein n=1 Tax=Phytophthora sojae (strain P6497) TaxID=1094619 RepID=G5A6T5_PHYSP|nr:hypothetical protein PHYSODRAFT_339421 [Phytophthora sojae]EGZ09040.1 hypothetical protein PHYSODRAFT_339421 [Phytophthora sojae]|eukprot:XP_009535673.1 hypothetical protein PHYSODRAFT_339421 [Phytophthora sojae]